MFDNVIEITKEQITGLFAEAGEFIPFEDILKSESIEPAYKHYFKAELNKWMFEFKQIFSSLRNFDLSTSEVKNILDSLYGVLPGLARFDIEDFEATVFSAVKLRCHYLLRPQNTLSYFVFGNALNKSVEEILLLLEYFYDYQYLISSLITRLNSVASEASNPFVSIYEFKQWIHNIDIKNLALSPLDKALELFEPMFKFFNNGKFEPEISRIPTLALVYFFDDKRHEALTNFFEMLAETNETMTIAQIFDSITQYTDSYPQSNSFTKIAESKPHISNTIIFDRINPFVFSLPDKIPSVESNNFEPNPFTDINYEFTGSNSSDKEKELITSILDKFDKQPNVSNFESNSTESQAIELNKFDDVEVLPQEGLQDVGEQINSGNTISGLIPLEKRTKFVEELFHSLESAYEKLLSELDSAKSLEEAIHYATQYFDNSGVSKESPTAQELLSFIRMKFAD
jgi:hypothetical protein